MPTQGSRLTRWVKQAIADARPTRTPLRVDDSDAQYLEALAQNPGFKYLTAKLEQHARLLEAKLLYERHADMRETDFLQSGVFWCRWLTNQIALAKQRRTLTAPPVDFDLELFKRLDAQVERVGDPNDRPIPPNQ